MSTQRLASISAVPADLLERLGEAIRARRSPWTRRSFAVLRLPERAHDGEEDEPASPARGLRAPGRHYALALVALLDALAAERPGSPLATASGALDDVRAAAFGIAAESAAAAPDLALIDRALSEVDRRLTELRVPLQVTGYLPARDRLRGALAAAGRGDTET